MCSVCSDREIFYVVTIRECIHGEVIFSSLATGVVHQWLHAVYCPHTFTGLNTVVGIRIYRTVI